MSEIARCTRCRGRKVVVGLGGMIKKCPDCKGVGFVSSKTKEQKTPDSEGVSIELKTAQLTDKKKRGRPDKVKSKEKQRNMFTDEEIEGV